MAENEAFRRQAAETWEMIRKTKPNTPPWNTLTKEQQEDFIKRFTQRIIDSVRGNLK